MESSLGYPTLWVHNGCFDVAVRQGDHYMRLADLRSYLEAASALCALYADRDGWACNAILNTAASGPFSSDHTISQYANEIWKVASCSVPA